MPVRATGELVLPEWLMRAAAESADPAPVPAGSRAVETEARLASSSASIPTGDLPSTIPDWLKRPVQPVATDRSEESLLSDPTDTRGFITEDDLPAWIREIAAADTSRKAEAERNAAMPEPAASEAAESIPPAKRRLLPGEIEAVRTTVNASPREEDHAPVDEPPAAAAHALAAPASAESAVLPRQATDASGSSAERSFKGMNLRYLLIGAILVVLAILVLAIVFL